MAQASGQSDTEQDRRYQSALLLHLVIQHPVELTVEDLVDQLATEDDPAAAERVIRAIERLTEDGLLGRRERLVIPTRAALRSYELWEC